MGASHGPLSSTIGVDSGEEFAMPALPEREASKLFSTAVFRELASGKSSERADGTAQRLRKELGLMRDTTNHQVVSVAYELLRRSYRSEYFYRNLITSKVFVGRHRASNSVLLNEFRVGDSVADCILVNGRGAVYEIKAELDSPEKLRSQLDNYYRAFPYVNVVAHADDVDRYLRFLEGTPVGLIAVGARDRLSTVKIAEAKTDSFEIRTMFNTLRASEITAILTHHFGTVPQVPNGLRYVEHLGLAEQIPPVEFQASMQSALKTRKLRNSRSMMLNKALTPLRAVVVQLDPDYQQQDRLLTWLKVKEA
jgi:hypothetical protein